MVDIQLILCHRMAQDDVHTEKTTQYLSPLPFLHDSHQKFLHQLHLQCIILNLVITKSSGGSRFEKRGFQPHVYACARTGIKSHTQNAYVQLMRPNITAQSFVKKGVQPKKHPWIRHWGAQEILSHYIIYLRKSCVSKNYNSHIIGHYSVCLLDLSE